YKQRRRTPLTNKVIKSVSFNVTNPHEYQMLKAVKRRNFSGYVKKLIAADLLVKGKQSAKKEATPTPAHIEIPAEVAPEQSTTDKLAQLKRGGFSGPKLF